jgi:uncharacterized protein YjbI with pentapeptide repeats
LIAPGLLILVIVSILGIGSWWILQDPQVKRLEFATTLAQGAGASAVLVGLFFTWKTVANSDRNLQLANQSNRSTRFYTAIEKLGDQNIHVQIGALHALSSIAHESPEDRKQCVAVIMSYLRHSMKNIAPEIYDERQSAAEAAIRILGRRPPDGPVWYRIPLDFSGLQLSHLDFRGGWFADCNFDFCDLSGSDFSVAVLHEATFINATLTGALFDGAGLFEADFSHAFLHGATFYDPFMDGGSGTFTQPEFNQAMKRVKFLSTIDDPWLDESLLEKGHRLYAADFREANTAQTVFHNTNLEDVKNITVEQLRAAKLGTSTRLPSRFASLMDQLTDR